MPSRILVRLRAFLLVVSLIGPVSALASDRGDLAAVRVDATAATWACSDASISGTVSVEVAWRGPGPLTVGAMALFFEDVDLNGRFDAAADTRLCQVPVPPTDSAEAVITAACSVEGRTSFSEAPITVLVDAWNVVEESDERNNTASSAWDRQSPPPAVDWTPQPKWSVNTAPAQASARVAQLTDDNGDGRIDGADQPDVLWVKWLAGQLGPGLLEVVDGRTGAVHSTADASDTVTSSGAPAIGDLDGDGIPEIVAAAWEDHATRQLICFDNQLNVRWRSTIRTLPGRGDHGGSIRIANLDASGPPEVVIGACVYSSTGEFLADGTTLATPSYHGNYGEESPRSAVADIDGDGRLEIVAGASACRFRGGRLTLAWKRPDVGDALSAVADLDADGTPEVILTQILPMGAAVRVLTATGANHPSWNVAAGGDWLRLGPGALGAGAVGHATIADLDGDGDNEIVVASLNLKSAVSHDGSVLWQANIADFSGSVATTAFDFDADGRNEVVTHGETELVILDGVTGARRATVNDLRNTTVYESPTVADIDGDGHADILAVATHATSARQRGLWAFSNATWAAAESSWHQDDHHVTDILDPNVVPVRERPRWLDEPPGDYRRQVHPRSGAFPAADLTVSRVRHDDSPCAGEAQVTAVIGNAGAAAAGPFDVAIFDGAVAADRLVAVQAVDGLAPGQAVSLSFQVVTDGLTRFIVVADHAATAAGSVPEASESNNACSASVGGECAPELPLGDVHLAWIGDDSADHHDPVRLAVRATSASSAPIEGLFVELSAGAWSCEAVTDVAGEAECWVTIEGPDDLPLSATSLASPHWSAAALPPIPDLAVGEEEASLTFIAPLVQPVRPPALRRLAAAAIIREDGAVPIDPAAPGPPKSLVFTVTGAGSQAAAAGTGGAASTDLDDADGVIVGDNSLRVLLHPDDDLHDAEPLDVSVHVLPPQLLISPMAQVRASGDAAEVTAHVCSDGLPVDSWPLRAEVVSGPSSGWDDAAVAGVPFDYVTASTPDNDIDVIRAWMDLDGDESWDPGEPAGTSAVHVKALTETSLAIVTPPGSLTSDFADAHGVKVRLEESGASAVPGAALKVTLGTESCRGVTDGSGELTCWFTPDVAAGAALTLNARFEGDPGREASEVSAPFAVTHEDVRLSWVGYSWQTTGGVRQYTLRARLAADGARPIADAPVVFTVDGTPRTSVLTDAAGLATDVVALGLGSHSITASFAGDAFYDAAASVGPLAISVSPATPASGSITFVINSPPTPTLGAATARGDGTVEVTFTPGSGGGAAFVTGYLILADGATVATVRPEEISPSGATSRWLTRAPNGVARAYSVAAVTPAGPGTASATSSATTRAIPSVPASVEAEGMPASDQVEIRWTLGDSGGGTIASAQVAEVGGTPSGAILMPALETILALADGVPASFRVRSSNEVGDGPWSPPTATVLNGEPPSAPRALRGVVGDGVARLYWTRPENLNGGEVSGYEVTTNGGASWAALPTTLPHPVLSDELPAPNGTAVVYRIRALNGFGAGAPSDPWTGTAFGVPDVPTISSATPDNGSVRVQWSFNGDGGSTITGSRVGVDGGMGASLNAATPASEATRVIPSTANGDEVRILVTATNARGDSASIASDEVTPRRVPDPPVVTVVSVGSEQVTLRWPHPADGGLDIERFRISTDPPSAGMVIEPPDAAGVEEVTLAGLTNGRACRVSVRADSAAGAGAVGGVPTWVVPHGPPGAPRGVHAAVVADRVVRACWVPPADDGGLPVEHHAITVTGSSVTLPAIPLLAGSARCVTIDGLVAGDDVGVDVAAGNGVPQWGPSASSNVVRVITLPAAPVILDALGGNGQATVSWAPPTAAERGHAGDVTFRACPIPSSGPCVDVPGSAGTATLTGLPNGVETSIELRMSNALGWGPASSATVTPCGPADMPLALVAATGSSVGAVELTWEPPGFDGGCAIASYVATHVATGAVVATSGPEDRAATFSGLTECILHEFTVKALNGHDGISARIEGVAAGVPEAPTQVGLVPGDGLLRACWLPPAQDEDCAPVIGYRVVLTTDLGAHVATADVTGADERCHVFNGLANGQPYDVEVRTRNAAALSSPGSPAVTLPQPSTRAVPAVPGVDEVEVWDLDEETTNRGIVRLTGLTASDVSLTAFTSGPVSVPNPVVVPALATMVMFDIAAGSVAGTDESYSVSIGALSDGALVRETGAGDACGVSFISPREGEEVFDFGQDFVAIAECDSGSTPEWVVEWRLVDGPAGDWRRICPATGVGTGTSVQCDLDPTLLMNGQHEIRVRVAAGTEEGSATQRVVVTGQQKIGHFTLSYVDMTIPVAGMPVQVVRTYDSRDPRTRDFGPGWSLGFSDVRLELNRPLASDWRSVNHHCGAGCSGWAQQCVEEDRTHIASVTFPDGSVHRFRPVYSRHRYSVQPCAWNAATRGWVHFESLDADGAELRLVEDQNPNAGFASNEVILTPDGILLWYDGNETLADPGDVPFAPGQFDFVTRDGKRYRLEMGGGLKSITDRNSNVIEFTASGISANGTPIVTIDRPAGRITSITDPRGNRLTYQYDMAGQLWKVADRVQSATPSADDFTEYLYAAGLLSDVVSHGPVGASPPPAPLRNVYDQGRLVQVCQGTGASAPCVDVSDRDLAVREQRIVDGRGVPTVLLYDEHGRVRSSTRGTVQPATTLTDYTDDDQPTEETDADGIVTTTLYDGGASGGNVVSVSTAGSAPTTYTWGEGDVLLTSTRPATTVPAGFGQPAATTTRRYDEQGNLTESINPLGRVTAHQHDAAGNPSVTTDALGHVTMAEHVQGRRMATTDARGVRTTFVRDGNGNALVTSVEADSRNLDTVNSYDENDRLVRSESPDGGIDETDYDAHGRIVERRTWVDDDAADDEPGTWRRTRYYFDDLGRPTYTRRMDACFTGTCDGGIFTHEEHDESGNVIRTVSSTRYESWGTDAPSSFTLSESVITRTAYDEHDRAVKQCWGDGPALDAGSGWEAGCTWTAYSPAGRVLWRRDERGAYTATEYDAEGRELVSCGPFLSAADPVEDDRCDGRPLRRELLYDEAGRMIQVTTADGVRAVSLQDAAGRRTAECRIGPAASPLTDVVAPHPDPGVTCRLFEHDALGRVVAQVDANGKRTRFGHDETGQLISVTDAEGGVTTYGHDDAGNMTRQTDAEGRVTQFTHDPGGRRESRTLPLLQQEHFAYTINGALREHVDFAGRVRARELDPSTDLTTLVSFENDPPVATEYDAAERRVHSSAGGDDTEWLYESGPRRYLSQVVREGLPRLSYEHDDAGNRTATTTHDALGAPLNRTTYGYDAAGRLEWVCEGCTDAGGLGVPPTCPVPACYAARYEHAADTGDLERLTYGTVPASPPSDRLLNVEVTAVYEHEPVTGSLQSLTWTDAAGAAVLKFEYALDEAGRRTGALETRAGTTRTLVYGFDDLYRLTEEWVDGLLVRSFTYDKVGNRQTQDRAGEGVVTYAYDANDRLLSVDGLPQEWDANGNMTFDGSIDLQWDDQGRLVAADADRWRFAYDADGFKGATVTPAEQIEHIVDSSFIYAQVLEDRMGAAVTRYTRGHNPVRLTLPSGEGWWYLHDSLGSTRGLVGGSGTVTDSWDYDAFGEIAQSDARSAGGSINRWLFAAEERYHEIALDYLRARWMNPWSGRLLARDSWEGAPTRPTSINPYAYAENQVVEVSDPSGNRIPARIAWYAEQRSRHAAATVRQGEAVTSRAKLAAALLNAIRALTYSLTEQGVNNDGGINQADIHAQGDDLPGDKPLDYRYGIASSWTIPKEWGYWALSMIGFNLGTNTQEFEDRSQAIVQASMFVTRCGPTGVKAIVRRSFCNDKFKVGGKCRTKAPRIDVEVNGGYAFSGFPW